VKTLRTDFKTIDEYIAGFPEDVRRKLSEVRSTVRKAAPDATEKISYRMPGFDYNGSLVWFAAFKNHIGFYPTSSGISQFEDELKKYEYSKGAIQFPIDEPMPLRLITRIVKFRVAENAAKKAKGKKTAKS
jgi:uncharacterized protein YdhG (YjbR/CyaY superfamily)